MSKILIVDDSITAAKFVETVLVAAGHMPVLASDGDEALVKITAEKFDLIFLDVVMPKKNGYQLCREIKHKDQYKDIPVVMLTTKSMDSDKFWAMRQGADDYLIKPCTPEALLGVVNKYMGRRTDEEDKPRELSSLKENQKTPPYRVDI
jgi:twitching motility two-component system response regulator PilH